MSVEFPFHNLETAPEKAKPLLKQLLAHSGSNGFYAVTAESPETLSDYNALHQAFMATRVSNEKKIIVW